LGGAALEHGNISPHTHVLGSEFHGRELMLAGSRVIQKARLRDDLAGAADLDKVIGQGTTHLVGIAGKHCIRPIVLEFYDRVGNAVTLRWYLGWLGKSRIDGSAANQDQDCYCDGRHHLCLHLLGWVSRRGRSASTFEKAIDPPSIDLPASRRHPYMPRE